MFSGWYYKMAGSFSFIFCMLYTYHEPLSLLFMGTLYIFYRFFRILMLLLLQAFRIHASTPRIYLYTSLCLSNLCCYHTLESVAHYNYVHKKAHSRFHIKYKLRHGTGKPTCLRRRSGTYSSAYSRTKKKEQQQRQCRVFLKA